MRTRTSTALDSRNARPARRLVARRQLPLGRPDLPARQPAAARAADAATHIKPRLLGHWGTTPGPQLHLRAPQPRRSGSATSTRSTSPAPATAARAWSRTPTSTAPTARSTPHIDQDEDGLRRLFRQFSFPGGIPSHAAPETPGSIHEGGELGYSLSHAYGAAFDNPDLLVAAVVGDGEAETGPLATAGTRTSSSTRRSDGVVLPILHLNGYKIANPTVLARIPEDELLDLMRGYGYTPYLVSGGFDGEDPRAVHERMAATLDEILDRDRRRSRRRAPTATLDRAPALADDHPAHAEGLDLPEGDRRPSGREQLARRTRCRWRTRATPRRTRALLEDVAALATGRRSCSTTTARPVPSIAGARAARATGG